MILYKCPYLSNTTVCLKCHQQHLDCMLLLMMERISKIVNKVNKMYYTYSKQVPIVIIFFLAMITGLISCGKPETDEPTQILTVSKDTIYLNPFEDVDSIHLISSDSLHISGRPDWLTVTPTAAIGDVWIVFNYSSNPDSYKERTARLIVQSGTDTKTITLIQNISKLSAKAVLFAGGGYVRNTVDYGGRDGTGNDAKFVYPSNATFDTRGNLIVTDVKKIRSITPEGIVTTLPGLFQHPFYPTGVNDSWEAPYGAIIDKQGNTYVMDTQESVIYKYAADNSVSILAGSKGQRAFVNGKGTEAKFMDLTCMVMDREGNLVVADNGRCLRRVTPEGVVTTFVGNASFGSNDGPPDIATFDFITSMTIDKAGNFYIAQWGQRGTATVRKVTPRGMVSTLVEGRGVMDGPLLLADIEEPTAIAVDKDGNIFVYDRWKHIRLITPKGFVYTFNVNVKVAFDYNNNGLVVGPDNILYFADAFNGVIYKIIIDKLPK
jgi:sugar lactone lactonase YvrE